MAEAENTNVFKHRYGIEVLNDLQETFLSHLKYAIYLENKKQEKEDEDKQQHQYVFQVAKKE